MKTMFEKTDGINFKRTFIIFFAALVGFIVIYAIAMTASGNASELTVLWERITLARFRGRMFADIQGTFRFFSRLFLIGFNALLALWVYADGKKHNSHKVFWPVLTLFTGLIGWLIYMIKRLDRTDTVKVQGN